jgi:hypothetical protein
MIKRGMLIRLLPPTSVPKALSNTLVQKMTTICRGSMVYREFLSVRTGELRGAPVSEKINLILSDSDKYFPLTCKVVLSYVPFANKQCLVNREPLATEITAPATGRSATCRRTTAPHCRRPSCWSGLRPGRPYRWQNNRQCPFCFNEWILTHRAT